MTPVGWVDENPLSRCSVHPTEIRAPTRKHQGVNFAFFDDAEFQITVEGSRVDGLPIAHVSSVRVGRSRRFALGQNLARPAVGSTRPPEEATCPKANLIWVEVPEHSSGDP